MRPELAKKLSRPGLRFGRWKALSTSSKISFVILAIVILGAIFAPIIATHDPLASDMINAAPSGEHWFGTDQIGRDVYSRIVYGARVSLIIGILATLFALALAAVLGAIAATSSKVVSEIVMRLLDIVMSFPGIALAAVFIAVFGNSLPVLIMTIGFLYVPQLTRVVRANILDQWGEDYVSAAVVSGARTPWILLKHVTRNCVAPVLVFATVLVADAIVFEASLSFINAGVPQPEPSWGNIIADARQGVLAGLWWPALFPGFAIMITVLCLNILAEGLTDALIAAPASAPAKVAQTSAEREADALLLDPVKAYEEQKESLNQLLAQLREVESRRSDRFEPTSTAEPVLEVKDLCIRFPRHGNVDVVDHLSFAVRPGETMALVGESGCGKSITSLAIMGLLDRAAQVSGEILYNGKNLVDMSAREHNALRGTEIAMIYQDALSSLNPSMLIRSQMKQLTKRGGTRTMEELLELVGLDPERTLASYPHELSGGQRQRVLIAMALTRDPKLVIADEPTTALDVTVQKQVIQLLNELRKKLGFAMIFITHDLALVAEVAHSITVMYAGQVVEQASTKEMLTDPRHEYTRGLLGAVLSIEAGQGRLHQVPGVVPSPRDFPKGDRFAPRSSHPHVGLETKPIKVQVPGTYHFYASHPEFDELAAAQAEGAK
ncbi:MAG: dipeptide/oligopeptide/nickel ABC transporter permease/ATP-binding protein [Actinomycetaceae bacterium]|nr:dipeptide/oligopeptide/nickel ABC transporter permease/ATP-binding protein [Actinomycetaceae bacterium]